MNPMQHPERKSSVRNIATVKQFCEKWPAWSPAAVRSLILHAYGHKARNGKLYPPNGLGDSGALIRLGRRVLIDEEKWFAWIDSQQVNK